MNLQSTTGSLPSQPSSYDDEDYISHSDEEEAKLANRGMPPLGEALDTVGELLNDDDGVRTY